MNALVNALEYVRPRRPRGFELGTHACTFGFKSIHLAGDQAVIYGLLVPWRPKNELTFSGCCQRATIEPGEELATLGEGGLATQLIDERGGARYVSFTDQED